MPARCTGISRGRLNATTPSVVPAANTVEAWLGSRARSFPLPCARAANSRYAAITTTLDNSGASTAPRNRRCAWSTPARTMPTPYSAIWGAKTTSIDAMRSVEPEHLWLSTRIVDNGPAAAAIRMDSGTSTVSAQVSMADAVWVASAWFLAGQLAGDDRDDDRRQCSARGNLEDDIRQLVRRLVDAADAGGPHALGEHQPAAEPEDPRRQGDHRNETGGREDPGRGLAGPSRGLVVASHRELERHDWGRQWPAAERVELAQAGRRLDHLREADPL